MKDKKKQYHIAFIHHGAVPGGAPTSLKNLILGLKECSSVQISICCAFYAMIPFFKTIPKVDVIKYPRPCKISGKVAIGWASIYNVKTFLMFLLDILYAPFAIIREFFFLKRLNPDIVHLNSSILWTSAIAAKLNRYPIVWHIRENFIGGPCNLRRRLYALFIRKLADKVICISPSEGISMDGAGSEKIKVIYNSIDLSLFQEELYCKTKERETFGFKADDFIILSLGGSSFRKGAFQLIEALNYLDDACRIVIAGDSKILGKIKIQKSVRIFHAMEDFMFNYGIIKYYSWFYEQRLANSLLKVDSSRLYCPGVVDAGDLAKLISACDVLVFAGTTPHFARPIFEAWAMKKPVVVFDTSVMQEEVNDGFDGIIVKEHTGLALAEALKDLRDKPEKCRELGKCGWIKSQEKFDINKNAEMVLGIYENNF